MTKRKQKQTFPAPASQPLPDLVALGVVPVLQHDRARLVRADCMSLLAGLPEASIDLIITDPAYSGMNDHMDFGRGRIVGARADPNCEKWFEEFSDDSESFLAFLEACKRVLHPDRHIYVMFDSFSLLSLGHLMRQVFEVKNIVVWDKQNIGMGHYFRRRHELVIFASKGKRKLATRSSPDVWAIPRASGRQYPTRKPVAVFSRMIAESAEAEMVVLDPFAGSCSSGVAALAAGCRFVGGDTSERSMEVGATRLEAVLAGEADPLESDSPRKRSKKSKRG